MLEVTKRLEEWFNTEEGCDPVMDEIIGDVDLTEQRLNMLIVACERMIDAFDACIENRHDHPDIEFAGWREDAVKAVALAKSDAYGHPMSV